MTMALMLLMDLVWKLVETEFKKKKIVMIKENFHAPKLLKDILRK